MYMYVCIKMVNVTISIPHEIKVRLEKEKNQSGLISNLLKEYFGNEDDPEILRLKRTELIDNLNSRIKQIDYQIEIKERERDSVLLTKDLQNKRHNDLMDNIKKNFKGEMKRDMTDEELEEFMNRWENDSEFNLFKFIDEKS